MLRPASVNKKTTDMLQIACSTQYWTTGFENNWHVTNHMQYTCNWKTTDMLPLACSTTDLRIGLCLLHKGLTPNSSTLVVTTIGELAKLSLNIMVSFRRRLSKYLYGAWYSEINIIIITPAECFSPSIVPRMASELGSANEQLTTWITMNQHGIRTTGHCISGVCTTLSLPLHQKWVLNCPKTKFSVKSCGISWKL